MADIATAPRSRRLRRWLQPAGHAAPRWRRSSGRNRHRRVFTIRVECCRPIGEHMLVQLSGRRGGLVRTRRGWSVGELKQRRHIGVKIRLLLQAADEAEVGEGGASLQARRQQEQIDRFGRNGVLRHDRFCRRALFGGREDQQFLVPIEQRRAFRQRLDDLCVIAGSFAFGHMHG